MRKVSIYVMHAPRTLSFTRTPGCLPLLLPCHVECGSCRLFLSLHTYLSLSLTCHISHGSYNKFYLLSFRFIFRSFFIFVLFLGFCFIHKHT